MLVALLSASQFSVTSSATPNQIGTFWCWFLSGWVCVRSRTLWVSPMNPTVRLGVSPAAPQVFSVRGFEALFPHPGTLGCVVCLIPQLLLPVLPPSLSAWKCGTACSASHHLTRSASHCLATSPLCPGCPSLPLQLVWMNVSSLTPLLSDFHRVWFSGSYGYFLFLNLLLSFFWLFKEA